jgi:glutaredoxin
MAAKNSITGDEIKSKALSKQGRENYDFIFRKKQMKQNYKLASATWCGPCSALKSRIAKEGLSIEIEDMDDNPDFFKNFNIKSVPQLVIFKEESFETISGSEDIIKFIKENQ